MKKIISFCIWGKNPKYVKGAIENLKLQKEFYPDWVCRFYIHDSVPAGTKEALIEGGAEVVEKHDNIILDKYSTGGINLGWFWRFEVLNDTDVERFIVRDTDSRLSKREVVCVKDWERSGKKFHIIRDNRMHGVRVLAGTWGATKDFSVDYKALYEKFVKENPTNNAIHGGYDQFFLSTVIYPMIKNDVCIHDNYHFFKEEKVRPVPYITINGEFIGKDYEV